MKKEIKRKIVTIVDKVYQIGGLKGSSHSYLIIGDRLTALIDPGSEKEFPSLKKALASLNVKIDDGIEGEKEDFDNAKVSPVSGLDPDYEETDEDLTVKKKWLHTE